MTKIKRVVEQRPHVGGSQNRSAFSTKRQHVMDKPGRPFRIAAYYVEQLLHPSALQIAHIFDPERPSWEARLLVREIVSPSTAPPMLAQTFMQSSVIGSEKFCKMVRPEMTDRQAAIWADTLFSHAFFYILAAKPIVLVRGEDWLNTDFFKDAAEMIARFMIRELELPLPKGLKSA